MGVDYIMSVQTKKVSVYTYIICSFESPHFAQMSICHKGEWYWILNTLKTKCLVLSQNSRVTSWGYDFLKPRKGYYAGDNTRDFIVIW